MSETTIRPVQSAEIIVLVDNVVDQARLGDERVSRQPLFTPDGLVPLMAEHGLCILVRVQVDGMWRSILLDAGVSGTVAVANADALGVNLTQVEAAVLSHGHADHSAGFEVVAPKLKPGTPVVVHPDAFKERFFVIPDALPRPHPRLGPGSFPGLEVIASETPTTLLDGAVIVTGFVPRTTPFEKGMAVQYAVIDGKLTPDGEVRDDQAIVIVIEGKGTVVISGCAHAGIVNMMHHALELTASTDLYAVMGGFHLCWPTPPEDVEKTIGQIASLQPDVLMPIHCTGREAIGKLAAAFPGSFVLGGVGTRLVL